MSSFVNYFVPLAQDERTPIAREPVKNGIRNHRSVARVARRRAIERQRIEDAQVKQNESLTRNIPPHVAYRLRALIGWIWTLGQGS
jgi:hypothetical protein